MKINQFFFVLKQVWKSNFLVLMLMLSFFSAVGYTFYLKPLLENQKKIHAEIIELKIQLSENKKNLSKYTVYKKKLNFLKRHFF